jgi:restriction system protein
VLGDAPEHSMLASEVIAAVEKRLPLTEFESSEYPNRPGVRRFERIVRFATISPVKAGWLVKDKGRWSATEEGLAVIDRYPDVADLAREASRLYRKWKKSQPLDEDETTELEDTDASTATTTLEEAEEAAWSEIVQYLQEMNPYDFQQLVAALLEAMGYHVSWVAPPGPDQGIDVGLHESTSRRHRRGLHTVERPRGRVPDAADRPRSRDPLLHARS